MPLALKEGTSAEFPSNWTKEAETWRKRVGLSRPGASLRDCLSADQ